MAITVIETKLVSVRRDKQFPTTTSGTSSSGGGGGGSTIISDHNSLGGLQGGDSIDFYHLTSAEHTEITGFLGILTIESSDDLYVSHFLEESFRILKTKKNIDMIYTDFDFIDENGMKIATKSCPFSSDKKNRLDMLFKSCYINGSTTIIKKQLFDTIGFFDENNRYCYDYDMWFRLLEIANVYHLSKVLGQSRVHNKQISANHYIMNNERKKLLEMMKKRYTNLNSHSQKKHFNFLDKILRNLYCSPLFNIIPYQYITFLKCQWQNFIFIIDKRNDW